MGVTVADLDVVNPYFRSSDYRGFSTSRRPGDRRVYAGTNAGYPAISRHHRAGPVDWRARGDGDAVLIVDAAATMPAPRRSGALQGIIPRDYEMLYVVNRYRALTQTSRRAVEVLREKSRRKRTCRHGVVNNTHLADFTDAQVLICRSGSRKKPGAGLPLAFSAVPRFSKMPGKLSRALKLPVKRLSSRNLCKNPPIDTRLTRSKRSVRPFDKEGETMADESWRETVVTTASARACNVRGRMPRKICRKTEINGEGLSSGPLIDLTSCIGLRLVRDDVS